MKVQTLSTSYKTATHSEKVLKLQQLFCSDKGMSSVSKRERLVAKRFHYRLYKLLSYKFFWFLTLTGLVLMAVSAVLVYNLESHHQSEKEFIDYIVWIVGIVTTVGYGNIEIQTFPGKVIACCMMLLGSLYLWSYMAFLVTALIEPEIRKVGKEVHELEQDLDTFKARIEDQS
jgi:voltage-gated potassium channel